MTLRLQLWEQAQDDLFAIGLWIASQSDRQTARGYTDRIEAACARLVDYPDRVSSRDDLGPGLRSVAIERRAVIVYQVDRDHLIVERIVPRGRDIARLFAAGG